MHVQLLLKDVERDQRCFLAELHLLSFLVRGGIADASYESDRVLFVFHLFDHSFGEVKELKSSQKLAILVIAVGSENRQLYDVINKKWLGQVFRVVEVDQGIFWYGDAKLLINK